MFKRYILGGLQYIKFNRYCCYFAFSHQLQIHISLKRTVRINKILWLHTNNNSSQLLKHHRVLRMLAAQQVVWVVLLIQRKTFLLLVAAATAAAIVQRK